MKKIINIIGKINLAAATLYLFGLFGNIDRRIYPESFAQFEASMRPAFCWFLASIAVIILSQFSYKRFIESYRKGKNSEK